MRITSKGRVTIPADIRERAGLLPHTEVEFSIQDGGGPDPPCGGGGEEAGPRRHHRRSSAPPSWRYRHEHGGDHGVNARRGMSRVLVDRNVLLDVVGERGQWTAWPARYQSYFPRLDLITPA